VIKWASGEAPAQAHRVIFINLSKSFINLRMNHVAGNYMVKREPAGSVSAEHIEVNTLVTVTVTVVI